MTTVKKKGRPSTIADQLAKITAAKATEVIINQNEWKIATPPGQHLLRRYLKKEYIVQTLEDNTGWLIKLKR